MAHAVVIELLICAGHCCIRLKFNLKTLSNGLAHDENYLSLYFSTYIWEQLY